uniref:Nodal growth differentiation factor n=1 Tax=Chelydra serpentina TaxID=8475 RepID=A0A8C3XNM7_CHESE
TILNHKDTMQQMQIIRLVGQKWVIAFNFSSINPREELQLAELRLHLSRPRGHSDLDDAPVLLDIFYQQETTGQSDGDCLDNLHLGLFAASPTFPSNWMVLEVTEQFSKWFNSSSSIKNSSRRSPAQTRRYATHLPKREHKLCKLNSADNQVLLVLFSSLSKGGKRLGSSTLLQTAKELLLQSSEGAGSKSLCRRVDFHADFDGIGWGSWIVYPPKYNAFCCEGECPTSLEEEFQPTNNAYMQSLLKYYHPDHVPASCCSPLRMSPLSMLYYEEGRVTIGHHEDMIVEEWLPLRKLQSSVQASVLEARAGAPFGYLQSYHEQDSPCVLSLLQLS